MFVYLRNGFLVRSLEVGQRRWPAKVTERRTKTDWARFLREPRRGRW